MACQGATLPIVFENPAFYSFDSNEIEFANSRAQLKLKDKSFNFTETFDNDTGFTYDSSKAEFSGGQVQQIQQAGDEITFGINFNNGTLNANIADGSSTGTSVNGAVVDNNKLYLGGIDNRYATWDGAINASFLGNRGCIRWKYTPFDDGSPAQERIISPSISKGGFANNLVMIRHKPGTGQVWVELRDSAALNIYNDNIGTWLPNQDQEYEFSLNWNTTTTGQLRLFIDGVQFGATKTITGTRDNNIDSIAVGTSSFQPANFFSYGAFDDILLYNTEQHTSNYVPGYTVPNARYSESEVKLPTQTYTGLGTIQSIDLLGVNATNNPRYTINGQYWNGTSWVSSNGTFDQSNDLTTFNANISQLNVVGTSSLEFSVIFGDSGLQQSIAGSNITYTGQEYLNGFTTLNYLISWEANQLCGIDNVISSNNVRMIQYVDDVARWYNTANTSWENSNGAYNQANDFADLTDGVMEQLIASDSFWRFAIVYSGDGNTQEYIDQMTVSIDFAVDVPTGFNRVEVYGFIFDSSGSPVSDVTVTAQLENYQLYDSLTQIPPNLVTSTTTNPIGAYTLFLLENESMGERAFYTFKFTVNGQVFEFKRKVPNQTSVRFSDLTL